AIAGEYNRPHTGSAFRVQGSGFWFRVLGLVLVLVGGLMARARSPVHILIILLSLASAGVLAVQAPPSPAAGPARNNPHLGNKESIRSGLALYRVRCADCHGLDAKGYRGPDLTAILGDMPDEKLLQTLRKGVPGTDMPASTAPDDELLL